jgi:hypothetical protein
MLVLLREGNCRSAPLEASGIAVALLAAKTADKVGAATRRQM